jgi:hypothetical protein
MKGLAIEFAIIGVGILLLFIGDKIANIGNSVDSIVASKWTAVALIVVGGGIIVSRKFA